MSRPKQYTWTVSAMQYTAETCRDVHHWLHIPHAEVDGDCDSGIFVDTPEGFILTTVGDWIVRDFSGDYFVIPEERFTRYFKEDAELEAPDDPCNLCGHPMSAHRAERNCLMCTPSQPCDGSMKYWSSKAA